MAIIHDMLLDNLRRDVAALIDWENSNIDHGFRSFDFNRLESIVLWFSNMIRQDLFKTRLAKLLWLSDFLHFRRERLSLTGLAYVRAPYGPIPDNYPLLLNLLVIDGVIALDEIDEFGSRKAVIEPLKPVEDTVFTTSELKTLKIILKLFGKKSAGELTSDSHKEMAWLERLDGTVIPYSEADSVAMLSQADEPTTPA